MKTRPLSTAQWRALCDVAGIPGNAPQGRSQHGGRGQTIQSLIARGLVYIDILGPKPTHEGFALIVKGHT
jgi:hypothetical protein